MKIAKLSYYQQLDSVKIVIIISLQCQDWRKTDEKGRKKAGGNRKMILPADDAQSKYVERISHRHPPVTVTFA